ncbi:hypothetical protein C8F04DRAFT_1248349 [Mycena alexandri]|uniref:Uncharacterized protein n=1 Tax=Mycena alexandri TaxID=1745969 RepID=A0AAD6TI21_9AGAR|nr:hypothetical protein C8F04DRAFT_1248349 [Mycena alexandri]
MVNITSLVAAAGFMLFDFQGNVLDNSFARVLENNPVISTPTNFPPTGNQMWSLVPSLSLPGKFNLQSQQSPMPFLSYSGAPSGTVEFAQATVHASLSVNFVMQQSGNNIAFLEAVTNMSLTSWPIQGSAGLISPPVTYEVFRGAPQQFWRVSA